MAASAPRTAAASKRCSRRRFLTGAMAGAAVMDGRFSSANAAAKPAARSTVDFADPLTVKSMSGFLNSIHLPLPPRAIIEPLRPKLWRSNDLRLYDDIRSWGAKFEGPLSDAWGYPIDGNWVPPYADFVRWEDFVRTTAKQTAGRSIFWDIWNEPDTAGGWGGTRPQFFDTYAKAVTVIKETLGPDTDVGGPSLSHFDRQFLDEFTIYCATKRAEVNFLTWHELEPWSPIRQVRENLKTARRDYVENQRLAPLRLEAIHIHEFVGETDQYRPAELLAFLCALEQGGADAAARSCWGDNCVNNSIDGIVDPATFAPRADWWMHKFYAGGVDTRVRSTADFDNISILASAGAASADAVHAMVGYDGHQGAVGPAFNVSLTLNGISRIAAGDKVRVRIVRIPDAERAAVPTLPLLADHDFHVIADALTIELPSLGKHEVQAISLFPV